MKLIILDWTDNSVHIYKVKRGTYINEEFIESLGHNTNQCHYMFGGHIDIVKHENVI